MRKLLLLLLIVIVNLCSCSKKVPEDLVLVKGGTFVNTNSNYYKDKVTIPDFYIGKYEVTQKEWMDIMGNNPSEFKGDDLPVEMVSWYDAIEFCNLRSMKEGLKPYYNIDKENKDSDNMNEIDDIKWAITINEGANGYRLPTEVEWEYAAGGGQKSKSYTYSGSDDAEVAAWYWRNAGDEYLSGDWNWTLILNNKNETKSTGAMAANELGIYDMSGNVREWCWDWYEDLNIGSGYLRTWKGGGWIGDVSCCEPSYRGKFEANGRGPDQGLRVSRSK